MTQLTAKQVEANQLLAGPQRHTCFVGGARSGKTFLLTRATVMRASRVARSRHAILRFRANAARSSIALDTLPKVLRLCFPGVKLTEHRQDGYFALPNESQIWIAGLDEKERVEKILGQEFSTMYFNECSQIPYSSILVALTRLAENISGLKQRAYYDLNPTGKGHWTNTVFGEHKDPVSKQPLANPDDFKRMFLNPRDNSNNLSPEFLASLAALPERQRKRFYEGMYVDEVDGALWTYEIIERNRVETFPLEKAKRVVVAVDPSGAANPNDERRDEIGIVVCAIDSDNHGYVLADFSMRDGPAAWGKVAVNAFHKFKADRIVAEQNFGGEMVRFVIQAADKDVPIEVITASRGKAVRADPVSALYEKDRVHHVEAVTLKGEVIQRNDFSALEDQLCAFAQSGYGGEDSPDHADAAIWGLSHLMLNLLEGQGVFEYYMREAAKTRAAFAKVQTHGLSIEAPSTKNGGVLMLAPEGIGNINGHDGRSYVINADRTVVVSEQDVKALMSIGFTKQNAFA